LRVLMSVVERGSMAKAAESLATSQPAISRAIADLEYSLGVCLLDRGPRGIVPTPYGHALIKRGIAIFDELKQGVQDIEFLADPTAGEVRIAAPIGWGAGLVATVIDRLARRYPRRNAFRAAGLELPRPAMVTTTGVARIALVAKGRFLTIASETVLRFGGWESAIKVLPIDLATKAGAVGIITLKNRTLTPVAQLFIDCAREVGKSMAMPRRRQLQKP